MAPINSVDLCVDLIQHMSDKERAQVFEGIREFLPFAISVNVCVDGKGHNYRPIRETNYLFQFLNRTKVQCNKCGDNKWV